jgi:hypothetical protein
MIELLPSLPALDEEMQRRLVLQAAREYAPETFKRLRGNQPTFAELEKELRETLWAGILFCWTIFIPIAAWLEAAPLWRIRRGVFRHWENWLDETDPEVTQLIVEGAIRRILRKLPRPRRREARGVSRELDRISRHWSDFQAKLELLNSVLRASPEASLEAERDDLAERVAAEADPMTRTSLRRQFQALEGRLEAHRDLRAWEARLQAAQGECTHSLLHLRARLTLLVASGGAPQLASLSQAAADLQALNARLSAAQAATEEVLRLRM